MIITCNVIIFIKFLSSCGFKKMNFKKQLATVNKNEVQKTHVFCKVNSNFLWISWCLYQNSERKYPNETISRNLRGKKHLRNADGCAEAFDLDDVPKVHFRF